MPDKVITIDGVGDIAFPDSMTDAQINAAATRLYQTKHPTAKQPPVTSWVDTAVNALPAAGATIGGIIGATGGTVLGMGVGSVPGAVLGAGAGGAGGEAIRQSIQTLRGQEAPRTTGQALTDIGKEGMTDAAVAGVTGGVIKGVTNPTVLRGAASALESPIANALVTPRAAHWGKIVTAVADKLEGSPVIRAEIARLKVAYQNPAIAKNTMAKRAIETAIKARGGTL